MSNLFADAPANFKYFIYHSCDITQILFLQFLTVLASIQVSRAALPLFAQFR